MNRKKTKVGVAFSDFVTKESFFSGRGAREYGSFYKRSNFLSALPLFVMALIFIILFIRLFYVNVVQGAYYSRLSDENRTRTVVIPAPRGIIFDRMQRPLVRNVPVFEIIENGQVKIIEKEEALDLIAQKKDVRASTAREYLYKDTTAHVLGYTGQISEEEINTPEFKDYILSDIVGKGGLERQYEKILHGTHGRELYEVNASGERIRFLGSEDPVSGQNIVTTLDIDVMNSIKKAMKDVDRGAVVVSDPRTGGILGMYSKPSYDPNIFTHSKAYKAEGKYDSPEKVVLDSEDQPLLNRAISGVYPPGSTYKLITGTAGLETASITENTKVEDTGVIKVGGASFGTWNFLQNGKTEGSLNLREALKRSNDIYFYRVAEKIGVDNLDKYSSDFGLGKKTGIDLPGEVRGTVPGQSWKKRVLGEQWYLGDSYNMSIGQGYLETTPLQVHNMAQIVVNDGVMLLPHLIKGQEKTVKKDIASVEHLEVIKEGMKLACETGGTAYPLFNFSVKNDRIKIDNTNFLHAEAASGSARASDSAKMVRVTTGCKTGTAESHGLGDPEPHAWFTIFAPFHDPEILVTVLVENGGEGSQVAAPIAKEILTEYFERK